MKKLFVCAMALAAFVSCSKDDVAQGPELDSKNKTVEIVVKNGALATRAGEAGITAPANGKHGDQVASANAEQLDVLFANASGEILKVLPLSGDATTNDKHKNISGEYAVGEKVQDASANGGVIYTWHNVPWDVTQIAVVRYYKGVAATETTAAIPADITIVEKKEGATATKLSAIEALAKDESKNLGRELQDIILYGASTLKDTGKTHEVNEITYHYWRADVTVAPQFTRFEINNIECEDLGYYNLDVKDGNPNLATYGFDEMDIVSLTWNSDKSSYSITPTLAVKKNDNSDATVIGRMYGQYAPATAAKDKNTYNAETDGRTRSANAENAADAVKPADGNVWSWNVSPTSTVDGKEVAVWKNMTVKLWAYAYDYTLQDAGRDLTLNVIGLDATNDPDGGDYNFEKGKIYKLDLTFTEGDVKDQDQLCVEVTVDIADWTIVDELKPVFNNN